MTPTWRRLVLLALVVAAALADQVVSAAGSDSEVGAKPRRVTEGALLWRTGTDASPRPAPVLSTDVHVQVTGVVARASVRQEFINPSDQWAEAVYVFPLPEDAAVDHMRMQVGDRTIEGVIRERSAAKTEYEQAKREGKRASLVEQERPNIFTTSVANIPPRALIVVEIQYQQVVRYDQGEFRLRFPMVVGPRYIAGIALAPTAADGTGWAPNTDQVPDASRITPPVQHPSHGPINPVTLRVELDAGVPLARLESPHHPIQSTPTGGGRYHVTLEAGAVPADRDFELVWQPAPEVAPTATLFTEGKPGEVFALLVMLPPAAAARAKGLGVPREVIFVIDVSGSMHGASIEQAKAALRMALDRLQPVDTFNVIRFNHRTSSLFAGAEPATPSNLQLADQWVGALRADGGTEMLPALCRALDAGKYPDRLRQVIFLTDGGVGNEEQLFEAIRERLGESRLFTIGIGSAPNSHFMREAARLGRGTFTFIGSVSEVQQKMDALFRKLESPALTDVRLEVPGGGDMEILPSPIPDLYLGEPVIVTLRGPALPPRVVLRGRFGRTPWQREVILQPAAEGAGLSVHWANAKIGALLDARRSGSSEEAVRAAVVEVALAHHLVSRYTSLVAVDVTPIRPSDADLRSHALKTNLPHEWDYTAVFGLGQGATDGPLHLLVGFGVLILAAAVYIARHRALGYSTRCADSHDA